MKDMFGQELKNGDTVLIPHSYRFLVKEIPDNHDMCSGYFEFYHKIYLDHVVEFVRIEFSKCIRKNHADHNKHGVAQDIEGKPIYIGDIVADIYKDELVYCLVSGISYNKLLDRFIIDYNNGTSFTLYGTDCYKISEDIIGHEQMALIRLSIV